MVAIMSVAGPATIPGRVSCRTLRPSLAPCPGRRQLRKRSFATSSNKDDAAEQVRANFVLAMLISSELKLCLGTSHMDSRSALDAWIIHIRSSEYWVSCKMHTLLCALQASTAELSSNSTAAVALTPQKDKNLFVEPLARNLILGVGAGIACEAVHVFTKVNQ